MSAGAETLPELLARLEREGVELWLDGDRLRYRAGGGAPVPALLAAVREHRDGIRAMLAGAAGRTGGAQRMTARPPREALHPLGTAQEAFRALDRALPGNPYSNVFSAFRLSGELDAELLAVALREAARRHEALRTTFTEESGVPRQSVASDTAVALEVDDLSGLSAEKRRGARTGRIIREALQPFDLARGPLLRAVLLRMGPGEHFLLLTVHHIVGDDWSVRTILGETAAVYEAFLRGEPSPLSEQAVQYADFDAWQRGSLAAGRLEGQLAYWRRQLDEDARPPFEVPADPSIDPQAGFETSTRTVLVPADVLAGVRRTGAGLGCTLFMALAGVFAAALARLADADDVRFATLVADRKAPEAEGIVGPLINTVILRMRLDDDPTLEEVLARARTTVLDACENQDIPFGALVRSLDGGGAPASGSHCSVLFNVGTPALPPFAMGGVEVAAVDVGKGLLEAGVDFHLVSSFDLVATLSEGPEGVSGSLVYKRARFPAAAADRLAKRLLQVAEAVAFSPRERLFVSLAKE